MNNLTATDVAQTLSLQRRDSSRRFERLPPEGREEQGTVPGGNVSGVQKLRTPARVPALQTEVRATSLGSGFNKIPRGFWKVSTRQARVPAPHRYLLTM
jgi:hypothetical protein